MQYCRSPHGERGLKCKITFRNFDVAMSLSSRRAWIEITLVLLNEGFRRVALLTESVD